MSVNVVFLNLQKFTVEYEHEVLGGTLLTITLLDLRVPFASLIYFLLLPIFDLLLSTADA